MQASSVEEEEKLPPKAKRPKSQDKTARHHRRKKKQKQPEEAFEDEYDEIRIMLKSLLEKKQSGKMNALDKKLLVELQKLIDESPANYSSKIGYL